MEIRISTNFPDVQRKLESLRKDIAEKALRSAVNKTIGQAQTQMIRGIRNEFNLTSAKIREKLFIRKAYAASGRWGISATLESKTPGGKRRAINLINFLKNAAGRKRKGSKSELRFKIKRAGGLKSVTGAFVGNKGRTVFARVGPGRLPIKPVSTIDVPQMFNTRRINERVIAFINSKFVELFERDVSYYTQRFGSR